MSWAEDEGIDAYDWEDLEAYERQQKHGQVSSPDEFEDLDTQE
ncbi:hypothetical protein [Limnobaculum xujianqingii]|nr:hypothetical protein [Limnobaculum xujianqingii]